MVLNNKEVLLLLRLLVKVQPSQVHSQAVAVASPSHSSLLRLLEVLALVPEPSLAAAQVSLLQDVKEEPPRVRSQLEEAVEAVEVVVEVMISLVALASRHPAPQWPAVVTSLGE